MSLQMPGLSGSGSVDRDEETAALDKELAALIAAAMGLGQPPTVTPEIDGNFVEYGQSNCPCGGPTHLNYAHYSGTAYPSPGFTSSNLDELEVDESSSTIVENAYIGSVGTCEKSGMITVGHINTIMVADEKMWVEAVDHDGSRWLVPYKTIIDLLNQ